MWQWSCAGGVHGEYGGGRTRRCHVGNRCKSLGVEWYGAVLGGFDVGVTHGHARRRGLPLRAFACSELSTRWHKPYLIDSSLHSFVSAVSQIFNTSSLLCLLRSPSPIAMAHPFEAHHILNLRAPCDSIRPPNVSGKRPASSFSQNGNSNSRNGEAPIPVCPNSSLAAGGSGVPTCVGKDNKKVSWGRSSDVGKRSGMEDSLAIVPGFMSLSCKQVGGCTAPECTYAAEDSPVHFFGLYDGHGGPQVIILSIPFLAAAFFFFSFGFWLCTVSVLMMMIFCS